MLQKLRDQTQSTGFKILVGAIIVVLTLFGFGASNLFLAADPEMARVGDHEITQNELAVETERERRRILATLGPEADDIDRLELQQTVLERLISRSVLEQAADGLGIRVPEDEVNRQLVESEAYQVEGQFNEAVYRQQVQALGYTPVEFIAAYTQALSMEQLQNGVAGSTVIPDWELGELIRVVNQRRDIAYLPLTTDLFAQPETIGDNDIALHYEENQFDYMTDESVDVEFVSLSVGDLVVDTEVSEEDLRSLYEDDRREALRDEQRDSAHILVQIDQNRNVEEAFALIKEIESKLSAGEEFESLAAQYSEDPGSAQNGGNLGQVGRGIFDPAFEEALWALQEPGEISPPVQSEFGLHLIRLNEVVASDYPEFEEVRESLISRVREASAGDLFTERVLELERLAFEERYSLTSTAEQMALEVQVVERVSQSDDRGIPQMGRPEVLQTLFSGDVLDGFNSEAVNLDDEVLIVRVRQVHDPEPVPLESVTDDIRSTLVREAAMGEIELALESGLARLEAGESVADIARSFGSTWQNFPLVRRVTPDVPASVLDAAFRLPRPVEGEKSVGSATIENGIALITVTNVVQGEMNTTEDAEIQQLRVLGEQRSSRFDFDGFYSAAAEEIGISRGG